jgi:sulfide:quinone oxidoreductase
MPKIKTNRAAAKRFKKTGSGKNAALIPFLDPTEERWIWWLLKVYALKPMTQYGMLAGRA